MKTPAAKGKAQKIYASTCRTCHDSGLLGAPRLGNKDEWAPRVSKGRAVLLDHTINGFQKMPPRGGRPSLTSKDLGLVLDYMLSASQ
jgi:cytochrome c5